MFFTSVSRGEQPATLTTATWNCRPKCSCDDRHERGTRLRLRSHNLNMFMGRYGTDHPCSRAVFTGEQKYLYLTREHRPSWRSLFAGRACEQAPVNTAPVDGPLWRKNSHAMLFANTTRRHGCSDHTTRIHGPCWQAANTGIHNNTRVITWTRVMCTDPISRGQRRNHGRVPAVDSGTGL